jgi:hypothetical protein
MGHNSFFFSSLTQKSRARERKEKKKSCQDRVVS